MMISFILALALQATPAEKAAVLLPIDAALVAFETGDAPLIIASRNQGQKHWGSRPV